ncbi:tyrosinase central domain containing protein [Colletotrichum sojae]|uniref:Tyrosinase central domain containing protein n=1 Tax=Colletotrichum sojae TaxID=2175907 RepID=A0A8H6JAR9_9PEZI|nr:tyrosinase central domain containing protein [Colletotrichum sojae]
MKSVSFWTSAFWALASLQPQGASAAPSNGTHSGCCRNPLVRHEWRQLSLELRLDYIRSVKYLMALPSEGIDLWPGAKSRFDGFQGMHIYMTQKVHFNPWHPGGLPAYVFVLLTYHSWHRWMLYLYESELRSKCSYKGALPYWDVSLENTAETFLNSPVFDNVYGVGGNGPYIVDVSDKEQFPVQKPIVIPERSGGGCVQDGPFANITVPMGLGFSVESTPHCLRRDFSLPIITNALRNEVTDRTIFAKSFSEFNHHIQGYSMQVSGMTLHAGLHLGIGGAVGDNDWQRRDWPARKTDIGGPDVMYGYPFNYFGDVAYENITLQYQLSFPNFGPDIVVSDMMDIHGGPFCYEYK